MKIKWLGHASFVITSDNGTKILTDPYEPILGMNYGPIDESADIVTVSHEHGDHNNVAVVKGKPQVLKESAPAEIKGIRFSGVDTFHDNSGGSERGSNVIYCFDVDGVKICHLGDLGHRLGELRRMGGGQGDHRNGLVAADLARGMNTDGGVGVDQHASFVEHGADCPCRCLVVGAAGIEHLAQGGGIPHELAVVVAAILEKAPELVLPMPLAPR